LLLLKLYLEEMLEQVDYIKSFVYKQDN